MITIEYFTEDKIQDVIQYEKEFRQLEDSLIDENKLMLDLLRSFDDTRFDLAYSLLAYQDHKIIGRIDASILPTRYDGMIHAYLENISVLKYKRHQGIAQMLLKALKAKLKEESVDMMIAIMSNPIETRRFYQSIEGVLIYDSIVMIPIDSRGD